MIVGSRSNVGEQPTPRSVTAYFAYGLKISSEIVLEELTPLHNVEEVDLRIRVHPGRAGPTGDFSRRENGRVVVGWPEAGSFSIAEGSVDVYPVPNAATAIIATAILGHVLGLVLHLRGHFVLHASSVRAGAQAAVIMGDSGAGKSTLAAVLLGAGYDIVSDDVVAFGKNLEAARVLPAFPQVKLLPDAAAYWKRGDALTLPSAGFEDGRDRSVLSGKFNHDPPTARVLYALGRGTQPGIYPLRASESLAALLRFSYAPRFGRTPLQGSEFIRHLEHAAWLSSRVAVRSLIAPTGVDRLGEAAGMVEEDLRSLAP